MPLDPSENVTPPKILPSNPIRAPHSSLPQEGEKKRIRQHVKTASHAASDSPEVSKNGSPERSTRKPKSALESGEQNLVNATRKQIQSLADEIAQLAKSNCGSDEFFQGFLTRTTSALASVGGAVWKQDQADQPIKLNYQINLSAVGFAANPDFEKAHHRLLQQVFDSGEPALIGPKSGNDVDVKQAGNPTEFLLLLVPLKIDRKPVGLVEIFQRTGAGPTTQNGYLRFLIQMTDLANQYLANEEIRDFADQKQMWQRLEHFFRQIYEGLDLEQTVYDVANEGRRLIECDRLSVALGNARNCRIRAVSGLDSIERRAEQVRQLNDVTRAVIRSRSPVWYAGDQELPPQIEQPIHNYIDCSHTRMLAVIPIYPPADAKPDRQDEPFDPIGAIVIEQLKDSIVTPSLENRANMVALHAQSAIANAREHRQIFLLPLWKTLGKAAGLFQGTRLLKTLLVLTVVAAVVMTLAMFPYSFGLGAKGSLIPEQRHHVFAKTEGTIVGLDVSDNGDTMVDQGQVLAWMENSELDLSISNLAGKIAKAREEVISANLQIQNSNGRESLSLFERIELENRARQASQLVISLENEKSIREKERQELQVLAPAAGRVIDWNLNQKLMHRPIEKGQKLMTVIDPKTRWLLELEMPERRLHHLFRTMSDNPHPMVHFGLLSRPGLEFEGRVIRVDQKLEVYSDEGNTALVLVEFDNSQLDPELLRSETRVNAQVLCGNESLGYVIFHELIETVQSTWLFWF